MCFICVCISYLCGVDKEKLAGHILMQRIFPSALPGYQLRDGSLSAGNTLSEVCCTFGWTSSSMYPKRKVGRLILMSSLMHIQIGVFGTFLGDTTSAAPPPVNRYSGYLVSA